MNKDTLFSLEMSTDRQISPLTRRQFLRMAGVGAGTVLLSSCGFGSSVTTHPPLPAFPRSASTGRVSAYTLEPAPVTLSLGGKTVSTWAYNGSVPGPTLRLTEGDTLKVTVKNRLPQGQGTTFTGMVFPSSTRWMAYPVPHNSLLHQGRTSYIRLSLQSLEPTSTIPMSDYSLIVDSLHCHNIYHQEAGMMRFVKIS